MKEKRDVALNQASVGDSLVLDMDELCRVIGTLYLENVLLKKQVNNLLALYSEAQSQIEELKKRTKAE